MRILSNSAKFSAGRPPLPAYNFSVTMTSTTSTNRFGAVAYLKLSATENRRSSPHFSAYAYYGQTVGWIRTPLDTEVSLGPDDIVLDRDPATPWKGAQQPLPLFGPLIWPASPQALILPITRIVD